MRAISRADGPDYDADGSRLDRVGLEPFAEPERDQDAGGVGRELDAGAGLFELRRLFEHGGAKARPCASVSAAVSPPMPAPAMMTLREARHGLRSVRSGGSVSGSTHSFGRAACGIERRVEAVERRAIRSR